MPVPTRPVTVPPIVSAVALGPLPEPPPDPEPDPEPEFERVYSPLLLQPAKSNALIKQKRSVFVMGFIIGFGSCRGLCADDDPFFNARKLPRYVDTRNSFLDGEAANLRTRNRTHQENLYSFHITAHIEAI